MKSISKIYFLISFIVLLVLVGFIVFFTQESKHDNLQEIRKFVVEDFEKLLTVEKRELLIFALALSANGDLKKILDEHNLTIRYHLLENLAYKFTSTKLMKELRLQVLDNNFKIVAQNWKENVTGITLSSFRTDLQKLKENKLPQVGIEVGRRLTFKATIPIEYNKNHIGYLEVIKFVDELSESLHHEGMELIVLMKPKYILEKNSLMDKFPRLQGYVIANENCNNQLIEKANFIEWKKLESLGYYEYEGMLFILKSMVNGEGDELGKYLIILPKETFSKYQKEHQNISLLTRFSDKDIYNFVKYWEDPNGSYKSIDVRKLIKLYPNVLNTKKADLKYTIEDKLSNYSHDQLINIILDITYKEKKEGEVK